MKDLYKMKYHKYIYEYVYIALQIKNIVQLFLFILEALQDFTLVLQASPFLLIPTINRLSINSEYNAKIGDKK